MNCITEINTLSPAEEEELAAALKIAIEGFVPLSTYRLTVGRALQTIKRLWERQGVCFKVSVNEQLGIPYTYRLKEGHVYKLHQPIDAKHAKEFWFVVKEGKCKEVSEAWMMNFARGAQADKEASIWGNTHAEDSMSEVLGYE